MGANVVLSVSLVEYLLALGKGVAGNVSFSVGAGITKTDSDNPITPLSQAKYLFIWNVQFDGIQSGQVGFEFEMDNGSTVSGYAVPGTPDYLNIMAKAPMRYQVQNGQNTTCVVNIDYLSIPDETYNEVLSALADLTGGRFGGISTS